MFWGELLIAVLRSTCPSARKQDWDLKVADFERHSVWEYALNEEGKEGQNEATVRPWRAYRPWMWPYSMFIVRASFTLADGTAHKGYIASSSFREIRSLRPTIVTSHGHVGFWCGGIPPEREEVDGKYERLERDASSVFPVQFSSDIPAVPNGPITGSIPAFLSGRGDQIAETT